MKGRDLIWTRLDECCSTIQPATSFTGGWSVLRLLSWQYADGHSRAMNCARPREKTNKRASASEATSRIFLRSLGLRTAHNRAFSREHICQSLGELSENKGAAVLSTTVVSGKNTVRKSQLRIGQWERKLSEYQWQVS